MNSDEQIPLKDEHIFFKSKFIQTIQLMYLGGMRLRNLILLGDNLGDSKR